VAELSGKPGRASVYVAVDYQARANACPKRNEENVSPPARGPDLKLAVSGRVRVVIYDYRKPCYARQLRDNVYLRKAGEVGHNLYAIRPSINKARKAYAYSSSPSARALIVAQGAGGFGYLLKQRIGASLLTLYANFV
jgi:hypothetical protein